MITLIEKKLKQKTRSAISSLFAGIPVFLFLIVFLFGTSKLSAQVSVYTFSQSLLGYTPLSVAPAGSINAPWNDNISGLANIGFTFNYNGAPFTQCRISANGFITFGATAPLGTNYTPLSVAGATYSGAISALGANLVSNGSPIVYGTEGASPNRTFVVQWTDAVRSGQPGNYNFQIRLHEATDVIECSYGACSTASTIPVTTQVGLRGANNTFAQGSINNRKMASNVVWFNNTVAGTLNNDFVRTVDLAYPDLGLSFTWTPAANCTTPTAGPTALVLGGTSVTNTSINGNSFTAASPAPTNYLVLRSTVNIPPTGAQVPNGTFGIAGGTMGIYTVVSTTAATTFTQTGLTADTTYYYWIVPYNGGCMGAPFYNLAAMLTGSKTTCSPPATAIAASAINGNDFTANWNAVTGATDYTIDVATDLAFTSIIPGYNNLSMGDVTTFTVTGLTSLTTYYYRIKAVGLSCPVNSNTITVTTTCGSYGIPYTQNFDATAIGVMPGCWSRIDSNGDTVQWGVQAGLGFFASSPKGLMIAKNPAAAMNDWAFMPGLNLTGGISYRLFFRYNTGSTGAMTENLKVKLGSSATIAAMTQTLLDLSNINNTIFKAVYVDFTPVISGTYYIGYEGTSVANQSYMAIDDVSVTLSPTCFEPIDVTASAITATTATVSWTPPVPDPALGYQYYLSTSATAPNAGTTPTGSAGFGINTVNLSGLTSSTSYYIWVRGNCGATDKSIWSLEENFSTECITPVVTGSTSAVRCGVGIVTLSATPNAGSVINWYAASSGGPILVTGNNYNTPTLNTTTTYYAEAKAFGAIAKTGPSSPLNHGGTIGVQNFTGSVNFTVLDDTTIQSIDIFPIASGQNGVLTLRTSSNITIATFPFTTSVSGGNTIQTVLLGGALATLAPGNYNINLSTVPASGLSMNTAGTFYPFTSAAASITGNSIDNTQYLGLYNWKFTTQCLSGRVPVTATVNSPPALGISAATSTICANTATGLITISGAAAYNTFTWSPSTGVSGSVAAGFTFNPTVTTTYTLTATQTSGSFCSNVVTHTVTVLPIPAAVSVIPASAVTLCQNTIQALNGSTGTMSAVSILTQDFNGATNNWTVANTSTDGDTVASEWTLRASTYAYASSTWNVSLKSNDTSKFYFSNADSQGSSLLPYAVTKTTLQSPDFSLVGYTSATLSFYQYLRYIGGDSFLVQVSTDSGSTWTTVKSYTSTQGAPLTFLNATVDLSAYLANPTVSVRFNFISNWGYGWAIDNVSISGTIATALSWSPDTGLYSDSAATIPYVLGTPLSVVYAKPMTTTTYFATNTGANGCTSSGSVTITVDTKPVGGTLSGNQVLCSGTTPTSLVLTGYTGNIIRWEYADDAAFTINVTPIANVTATLTSIQMGTITNARYFRAVVGSGVCANAYSSVASVSFPVTTWNGSAWSNGLPVSSMKAVFNGNFTSSANISACSVQVLSGIVTFASGTSLLVDNEVTVTGGTLIFDDTASLVQYNSAVNTGNIIYKRTTTGMRKYDYTYWSSPVAGQTLSALSPNSNPNTFYIWNIGIYNWSSVPAATSMLPAKGYIVRAPDIAPFNVTTPQPFYATFTGVPNNGTITTPIVVTGANNLNLIGNPYPSAISADLMFSDAANVPVLDATIYLWTHNTPITANVYTSNDYAVYNYLGGVGTAKSISSGVNNSIPTGNVAAGESFFIKGLLSGNATFKNTMRLINSNNQFFRLNNQLSTLTSSVEKHRIWLEIINDQGAFKQTLIGYAQGATLQYDRGFDGAFVDGGNVVGLYSISNADKLSIQGRPLPFSDADQVPLGYRSTIAGVFEIGLSQFDGLFDSQDIYLEDRTTNIVQNLKDGNYSFTTAPGTFDDRFVLRFTSGSLSTPEFNLSNVVIYKDNPKWVINSGMTNMSTVRVFDVRGSLLYENKSVGANQTSFYAGSANQVLLVQITSAEGAVITKKVIN